MKQLAITTLLLSIIACVAIAWLRSTEPQKQHSNNQLTTKTLHTRELLEKRNTIARLQAKATIAKTFTEEKGYNSRYCFLIDMRIPSGQNRFFVYDLQKDSVLSSGLVTHGRCNEDWLEGRRYSNTVGGGCTSLGKYKIGIPYHGRFGLAFKLHGLDKSNDNAFRRYVVLHAHSCVPETEVDEEICQSDGCPTVSPRYLQALEQLIRQSSRPVLLWIFE